MVQVPADSEHFATVRARNLTGDEPSDGEEDYNGIGNGPGDLPTAAVAADTVGQPITAAYASPAGPSNYGFSSYYTSRPKIIPDKIDEIVDEKTQFRVEPEVPMDQYPTKAAVLARLKEIQPEFSDISGFKKFDFEVGEKQYFLSKRYIDLLLHWLSPDPEEANAGTEKLSVDNSDLFEHGSLTKTKKMYNYSSVHLVNEVVWNQLMEWFGGGPELSSRKCDIKTSGFELKSVRVVCDGDNTRYRRFAFNSHETLSATKDQICEVFGIKSEDCRLHDFYSQNPFALLECTPNSVATLGTKHILDDNLLFIELPDDEGNYRIKYHGRTYQIVQHNDVVEGGGKPPVCGAVGLRNVGNTCYMNSMLQCLSNIPILRDIFLSTSYTKDINADNPLGYKGKLANAYFKLMEKMWSDTGPIVVPYGFKKFISDENFHAGQFAGYEQHDSQEFLSVLLDGLHEDLNRVHDKPYTETVQSDGRPDEVVALEAFETHKKRNDSVINDMFTGLFKSTVTCPDETCGNVSITFDPYMILPLPLQSGEKHYHVLQVLFVPMNEREELKKLELIVPKHGPFYVMRKLLMEKTGITAKNEAELAKFREGKSVESADANARIAQYYSADEPDCVGKRDLLIFRVSENRLINIFSDRDPLSRISVSHRLIAYEVFNGDRFQDFCHVVDEDWERQLQFDRPPRRRARYDTEKGYHSEYEDGQHSDDGESVERYGHNEKQEEIPKERTEEERNLEAAEMEAAKEPVGFAQCPLLKGDTWHGGYHFNDDEQIIRLEVLDVKPLSWERYQQYCASVLERTQMPQEETNLTRAEFDTMAVFRINAIVDTKERLYHYSQLRGRQQIQTEFRTYGIYFADASSNAKEFAGTRVSVGDGIKDTKNEESSSHTSSHVKSDGESQAKSKENTRKQSQVVPKKTGIGSLFFGSGGKKRNNNIKSKRTGNIQSARGSKNVRSKVSTSPKSVVEKETKVASTSKEEDSLYKQADNLKSGDLESHFLAGKLILRPTGHIQKHKKRSHGHGHGYGHTHGYYMSQQQDDESREPIVLSGSIDCDHRYFWGKFVVDMGFAKGEFFMQRWESRNWELPYSPKSIVSKRKNQQELIAKTKFHVPRNEDYRVLVCLCHRVQGQLRDFLSSIPSAFFAPFDISESEICDMIKAKIRIYLEKTIAAGDKRFLNITGDNETEDPIETILQNLTIVRSNSKFSTLPHQSDPLRIGRRLDPQSDSPLKVSREEFYVWLIIDWKARLVPFHSIRPSSLMTVRENEEARMTLETALKLFSRTEKLNAVNTWYCSKCKDHKEAYKSLQIWSLPEILVIQFKRFSQDEGRSTADKLEVPVEFPVDIDLRDYALNYQVVTEEIKGSVKDAVEQEKRLLDEFGYTLLGVSSHVGGGLGFGHYVATAKNDVDNNWYHFDDQHVALVDEDEFNRMVVNPQAYVIFFIKKSILEKRKKESGEVKETAKDETNK